MTERAAVGDPLPTPIGIVTVSDRVHEGQYPDRGGPAVRDYLACAIGSPIVIEARTVPDELDQIAAVLRELCDRVGCALVVTTGGTGPAPRDVTPEATRAVCPRELPGFGERMREVSLRQVPTAILSRQTAGVRGRSLVVNLPGQPAAVRDCLDAVMPAIPYCIELIGGPILATSPDRVRAYRPPGAARPHERTPA